MGFQLRSPIIHSYTIIVLVIGIAIAGAPFSSNRKETIQKGKENRPSIPSAYPMDDWDNVSGKGKKYNHIINAAALNYNLDPPLLKAIIHTESRFDPRAVSPCGATGLMQIMPGTASLLDLKDPLNPRENIFAGGRHFRSLLDYFDGDYILALAAYNAGIDRVILYGGVPPFRETQIYIHKVLKYFEYYSQKESLACHAGGISVGLSLRSADCRRYRPYAQEKDFDLFMPQRTLQLLADRSPSLAVPEADRLESMSGASRS